MTANEDQHIEVEGLVTRSIKGVVTVELDSGVPVQCYISGKMKRNKIQIVVGDRVRVKVDPYDPTKGFITYRIG